MVQDQTRMINLLIKQQSRYMSQLVEKIGGIHDARQIDGNEKDDIVRDGDDRIQMKNKDLIEIQETLELELKHASKRYEHEIKMLDSKYQDNVTMMEEKCKHRIAMKQEEFEMKTKRWNDIQEQYKEHVERMRGEKEETVQWYKKRIEELIKEYSDQIQTLRESNEQLRDQYTQEKMSKQLTVPNSESGWSEREIELLEKERKLQGKRLNFSKKKHII
ncbi:hypothetical protein WDU94_013694 [Cyamophila willieti]